jgi:hypothetical protein
VINFGDKIPVKLIELVVSNVWTHCHFKIYFNLQGHQTAECSNLCPRAAWRGSGHDFRFWPLQKAQGREQQSSFISGLVGIPIEK